MGVNVNLDGVVFTMHVADRRRIGVFCSRRTGRNGVVAVSLTDVLRRFNFVPFFAVSTFA